ncbi:NAD(P)-dependent dehydrogenase, short-chain alcohol dehydrogenase family [Novosphingobium sp. CF614]|nr:NAD(P)-dependent dehydrogenase, short-chain alcohol dehydrogenase family [Novosphingobium sp. CF614]
MISFEGQVAVVTGGGGGIGRMQALELARRGASVVVNDVGGLDRPEGPSADDVVAEIRAAGGQAVPSYDSVATPEGGRAIIECALDNFGTVDAILHYAGTWRSVLFDDMTIDQLDPVLDVHLRGAFFVTGPAWAVMKAKGYGRIVLCSSSTGVFGRRFGSNYSAAKAGLIGLGRTLSLEGREHGVFTNCLMPIARSPVQKYPYMPPKEMLEDYKVTGLPRPIPEEATTERLVPLPTYLASSACTVSGESFSGGGGRYARVFVGVTSGWLSETDSIPTAEDIAEHLDEIEDRSSFLVPNSIYDELREIADQLAARDGKELPARMESRSFS